MNELVMAIRLHTMNMAMVLGMSEQELLKDCSIRELLLYIGTLCHMTQPESTPEPKDDDGDVAAFVQEVTS